jgi:hypothetical protein
MACWAGFGPLHSGGPLTRLAWPRGAAGPKATVACWASPQDMARGGDSPDDEMAGEAA